MDLFKTLTFYGLLYLTQVTAVVSKPTESPMDRFKRIHACSVKSTATDRDGFVPYNIEEMYCTNGLTPSTFWNAKCEYRCRNPVNRSYMKTEYYEVESVPCFKSFNSTIVGKVEMSITVSCRCVATWKGKQKCRGPNKKRGCGQQWR